MHAALFAPHAEAFPSGSVISICARSAGEGAAFRTAGFVTPGDADAAWKIIAREGSSGDTWVSVGIMTAGAAVSRGRGKKEHVQGLVALVVDIDTADGEHRVAGNPTRAEVAEWLVELPIQPTVIVDSSGGFHWWFALDTPLDPHTSEGADLILRHQAFWLAFAQTKARNIDAGPMKAITQVLRPAGTLNFKSGKPIPVALVTADGPRHSQSELHAFYPPLPEKVAVARTARVARQVLPRADNVGERPGDRFAKAWPVEVFLAEVFGADVRGNGIEMPDPSGAIAGRDSGRVYETAAEATRVTFFSSTAQAAFGVDEQHSWTSFDVLAHSLADSPVEGYRAAARLITSFQESDWITSDLVELVQERMLATVAEAFGIAQPDIKPSSPVAEPRKQKLQNDPYADVAHSGTVVAPSSRGDDEAAIALLLTGQAPAARRKAPPSDSTGAVGTASAASIATAIASHQAGEYPMEGGKVAYVWKQSGNGQQLHGIYRRVRTDSGGFENQRLTSWVLFKSLEVERRTVGADGIELGSRETSVTLTLATASGTVKTMPGFSVAEAHALQSAIDTLNFGVEIPESTAAVKAVANSVRVLGAKGTGTVVVSEYGSTGWMKADSGSWVYLAPGGSVTAEGAVDAYVVGAPPGSDDGALTTAQRALGAPIVPQDRAGIRRAAESIPAYLAVTPNNRAAFAVLGTVLAAPLALASRPATFIAGLPDSGKSKAAACGQAFLTGDASGATFTGGSVLKASEKGSSVVAVWSRHAATFWDDYRVPKDDPSVAARMRAVVSTILQASYGGSDSGQKSTKTGGLLAVSQTDCAAVITGEALPEEEGIVSRTVGVALTAADVAMLPRGTSPLDVFRADFAGLAQQIYGVYLQALARRLNSAKTLAEFRRVNSARRGEMTPAAGRSAEAASGIALGWHVLIDVAEEFEFADLLPSRGQVDAWTTELALSNAASVKASNPARQILKVLRDQVAAGAASITLVKGRPGPAEAERLGWRWVRVFPTDGVYEPSRNIVGTLSADRAWVLVSANAVSDAKRRAGMDSLPAAQLDGGFQALVMEGTKPGDRSPRAAGFSQRRGYVIAAAEFDLA